MTSGDKEGRRSCVGEGNVAEGTAESTKNLAVQYGGSEWQGDTRSDEKEREWKELNEMLQNYQREAAQIKVKLALAVRQAQALKHENAILRERASSSSE